MHVVQVMSLLKSLFVIPHLLFPPYFLQGEFSFFENCITPMYYWSYMVIKFLSNLITNFIFSIRRSSPRRVLGGRGGVRIRLDPLETDLEIVIQYSVKLYRFLDMNSVVSI